MPDEHSTFLYQNGRVPKIGDWCIDQRNKQWVQVLSLHHKSEFMKDAHHYLHDDDTKDNVPQELVDKAKK